MTEEWLPVVGAVLQGKGSRREDQGALDLPRNGRRMTYCRCGHADIVHVDHFVHGRQDCDVQDCPCTQYRAKS